MPPIVDCSPKVGDMIEKVAARIIAKERIGMATDQNDYIVLCLILRPNDVRPVEYVTWTLQATATDWDIMAGDYSAEFEHGVESFMYRTGKTERANAR